ncbi:hypothetical protein BVX98_07085 [bacterium F11]|nr:hypothetical protein BVX98_07085 [bacterium F11]
MERDINTKVVVSGIGLVTSLGQGREKTWANLLNGKSGIKLTSQGLLAPIFDFVLNGAKSRMGDFCLMATEEALRDAGLDPFAVRGEPVGCAIGQSKPILSDPLHPFCQYPNETQENFSIPSSDTPSSSSSDLDASLLLASFTGWSAEEIVRNTYQLTGPGSNMVAACATGIAALDLGMYWIQTHLCSRVLVGASESSLHPLYLAGFEQMGVLAKGRSADAARPFDRNRSGFVVGEGAAVLLLEKEASAQQRGHKPVAFLEKTALRHSASDTIRFDPNGKAVADLMRSVTQDIVPDYINAHGTATRYNDAVETKGIRMAFEGKSDQIAVSSTKAATGHLLGAAGALEAAFSVLALRDGWVPPTLNLTDPDPECDLDYVPNRAREKNMETALSLSYGFGGQIGATLFRKYNGNEETNV